MVLGLLINTVAETWTFYIYNIHICLREIEFPSMTTTSTEQKTTTPKKQTKQSTKIDHLDKAQSTTNPKIGNSTISLLVYKDSLEPQLWHVLMGESFEANVRYELWSRKEKRRVRDILWLQTSCKRDERDGLCGEGGCRLGEIY